MQKLKLMAVGNKNAGKSYFLYTLCGADPFLYPPPPRNLFKCYTYKRYFKKILFTLSLYEIDLSLEETPSYLEHIGFVDFVLLCYDITDFKSLCGLHKWIKCVENVKGHRYLLGLKYDLREETPAEKYVSMEMIENMVHSYGLSGYKQVSAYKMKNIEALMMELREINTYNPWRKFEGRKEPPRYKPSSKPLTNYTPRAKEYPEESYD